MPTQPATSWGSTCTVPPADWRWDLSLVCLLLGGLLTVGGLEVRAYLAHRFDLPRGLNLLRPAPEITRGDLEIYRRDETCVLLEQIGRPELNSEGHWYRHGFGPHSVVRIWLPSSTAVLDLDYHNDWEDQTLTITLDGKPLETLEHLPLGAIQRQYSLPLHPGMNALDFSVARYLGQDGNVHPPADTRPMAGGFDRLELTF